MAKTCGRRPKRIPRITWDDEVAEILKERALTLKAGYKREWAKFVHD